MSIYLWDRTLAQGLSTRSLQWHYRSKHDSLIAVSNKEFYENKLVVFPCPDRDREWSGLVLNHLPHTRYDRGKTRTNHDEAVHVANRVMEHACSHPHLSLGVAAFSLPQAEAILNSVEALRRQHPKLESFFIAHENEPFFVKNLETVQGDERDVILISIGYGRTAGSDVIPMNFGALNREGGERRLNVLITRAKYRCEVFSSLVHGDIDLTRTQARGVVALKSFLQFAESGVLDTPVTIERESDSPFEDEVAECLRAHGIVIDQQVGSAGYFIDLAAKHPQKPGSYVLAIECDGASYHSSATARDRDRLRQQVLESLGWRFHRVWSADWYKNSERELKRLLSAYQTAVAVHGDKQRQRARAVLSETTVIARFKEPNGKESNLSVPLYQVANIEESYAGSRGELLSVIDKIVTVESPIHIDLVMWGLAKACGVKKVGRNLRSEFGYLVETCAREGRLKQQGEFLWLPSMISPPVRDRSNWPATLKKMEYIAHEEVSEALALVVSHSHGGDADEVIAGACRILGFSRVTVEMQEKVRMALQTLLSSQRIQELNGKLHMS